MVIGSSGGELGIPMAEFFSGSFYFSFSFLCAL